MGRATMRIADATRAVIREVATSEGRTMQAVLDEAIDEYRRRHFIERVNRGYAALRSDRTAAARAAEEQVVWEATLPDGLPTGERWNDDGSVRRPATARRKRRR